MNGMVIYSLIKMARCINPKSISSFNPIALIIEHVEFSFINRNRLTVLYAKVSRSLLNMTRTSPVQFLSLYLFSEGLVQRLDLPGIC